MAKELSETLQDGGTVYIVSPLPDRVSATNGVSRFTDLLATALSDIGKHTIVVAQKNVDMNTATSYEKRSVWDTGAPAFFQIANYLFRINARAVNVQHELFMYGKFRFNALFLLFLIVARLRGMRVVTTMHHVFTASALRTTFRSEATGRSKIIEFLSPGILLLNTAIALASYRTIVHSSTNLTGFPSFVRGRVTVIPLIVSGSTRGASLDADVERVRAEYNLPARFVLAFGFLSSYKGFEEIISAARMSPTVKYVIVAGKNIRGSSNESYLTYYDTVMQDAVDAGIRWINYIPENDVEAFFSAADSLVMPYTRSHAASGPLSIASSLGKPVILSVNVDAPEFHGLAIEPTAPALADAISRINMDDEYRDRLVRASAEFAERRSPVNTATAHVKALFD